MARIPIVRVGDVLIVTVREELTDQDALALQEDLGDTLTQTESAGVLLDLSAVDTVDSFLGRVLNEIAQGSWLLGARTVVSGIQPAVAITLVELGLQLPGVQTALNADRGLALLHRSVGHSRTGRNGRH